MRSLLQLLVQYKTWIYISLGITWLIYFKRLTSAWGEWRSTIFGLEREHAQQKVNNSLAMAIILLLMIIAEFILATMVAPEWEIVEAERAKMGVPTVQVNPMGTNSASGGKLTILATAGSDSGMTTENGNQMINLNQETINLGSGCIPGQVEWISPAPGEQIEGIYDLKGTVNVENLAFYKYDLALLSHPDDWKAIAVNNTPIIEGVFGVFPTTEVENGDYMLRLTVYTSVSSEPLTTCDVAARILNRTE